MSDRNEEPHFHTIRANTHSIWDSPILENHSVSWEARGLLTHVLSRPEHGERKLSDLQQNCSAKYVQRILKELKRHGYATETVGPDGKTSMIFHDEPQHE